MITIEDILRQTAAESGMSCIIVMSNKGRPEHYYSAQEIDREKVKQTCLYGYAAFQWVVQMAPESRYSSESTLSFNSNLQSVLIKKIDSSSYLIAIFHSSLKIGQAEFYLKKATLQIKKHSVAIKGELLPERLMTNEDLNSAEMAIENIADSNENTNPFQKSQSKTAVAV